MEHIKETLADLSASIESAEESIEDTIKYLEDEIAVKEREQLQGYITADYLEGYKKATEQAIEQLRDLLN